MAYDKLVDSTALDAELTTVADAIRAKGGGTAPLSFPAGMAQAISVIETGITPAGNVALTPTASAQTGIDVTGYATASVAAVTKELLAALDGDFTAANIKKGVQILGLAGTMEAGVELSCVDEIFTGTLTPDADVVASSLTDGFASVRFKDSQFLKRGTFAFLYDTTPDSNPQSNTSSSQLVGSGYVLGAAVTAYMTVGNIKRAGRVFYSSGSGSSAGLSDTGNVYLSSTGTTCKFYIATSDTTRKLRAGRTYCWVIFDLKAENY